MAHDVDGSGNYLLLTHRHVAHLHPFSSYLCRQPCPKPPSWVLYHEFTISCDNCIRIASEVHPQMWVTLLVMFLWIQIYLTKHKICIILFTLDVINSYFFWMLYCPSSITGHNSKTLSAVGLWSWPPSTTWGTCRQVMAKSCSWSWGRVWSPSHVTRTRGQTSPAGLAETQTGPERLTVSPAPSSVLSNEDTKHTAVTLYFDLKSWYYV